MLAATLLAACGMACGQGVASPCPEVLIEQKYDHVASRNYRAEGWDTAITCSRQTLMLSAEPYMPVTYFNGTYLVEAIPYNPPDPTFAAGTRMPVGTDDDFAAQSTTIPFHFFFFGLQKESFRLGANGLITFATDQFEGGYGCPWSFSAPLPWPDGTVGAPTMPEGATGSVPLARMRDAIYGIYEDTHPVGAYLSGHQGIYYGIQGEWPCRKIICSWNGIPTYKGSQNLDNRCTYQIVCYEGSNIVEVHVKHRGVNTGWQNGAGIIGIQNATGLPQVPSDDHLAPNYSVDSGAPAAFWPDSMNLFNTPLDSVAFRFTPQGRTVSNCVWYRIDDNGDSLALGTTQGDSNGYMLPMDPTAERPTLTQAFVSPSRPTRYVAALLFRTADNEYYYLKDTISVGVDTSSAFGLQGRCGDRCTDPQQRTLDVCRGSQATVGVVYNTPQQATTIQWAATHMSKGRALPLADSLYHVADSGHTFVPTSCLLAFGSDSDPDGIDTLLLAAQVQFSNGCTGSDTFMLRYVPSYDIVEHYGICLGDTLVWHVDGNAYSHTTHEPSVTTPTRTGCDSTVHLDLTVYDVTHTYASHADCKPYTWLDGRTYSSSNSATRETDTIVVANRYGCDSVVHLDFSYEPLQARIASSLEYFDYDHTEVTVADASIGSQRRLWTLPDGRRRTTESIDYAMPADADSALFTLVAYSPYGCVDTTQLVIPFRKATLWLPNAFTPDRLDGNRLFGPTAKGLVSCEMYIYNRLGQRMYYGRGTDCAWDGRTPDGRLCEQGAYVYVIRYRDVAVPSTFKTETGTVTLIR